MEAQGSTAGHLGPPGPPRLMTVSEVAEALRVGRSTVYQMIDKKVLPIHRVGTGRGTIRVSAGDLEGYLRGCRSAPEAKKPRRTPTTKLKHLRY